MMIDTVSKIVSSFLIGFFCFCLYVYLNHDEEVPNMKEEIHESN